MKNLAPKDHAEEVAIFRHGLIGALARRDKLLVNYTGGNRDVRRYECTRAKDSHGGPRCINFNAVDVDERVSELLLDVVRPAAIEAAILASKEQQSKGHDAIDALKTEIEAARYAADRAWRQFDASDPENRLVTGELERRWNVALTRVRDLEARVTAQQQSARVQAAPDREALMRLAGDLDSVWHAPATDVRLKKRIVRTLVEELIADVDEQSREIVLLIHWAGGVHTELRVKKRRPGRTRRETSVDVIDAIRDLALVCEDREIAAWLGRGGIRTVNGLMWSKQLIASYRSNYRIPRFSAGAADWTTLATAAAQAGVAWQTLRRAIDRGELTAKHPLPNGPWIVKQAEATADRKLHDLGPLRRRVALRNRLPGTWLRRRTCRLRLRR